MGRNHSCPGAPRGDAGDAGAFAFLPHHLRGQASSIEAAGLISACRSREEAARAEVWSGTHASMAAVVDHELARAAEALERWTRGR